MTEDYELVIVARGDLEESTRSNLLEQIKKLVEAQDGEIINIDEWGKKPLAYEIKKNKEGFYYLVNFKGNAKTPNSLNSKLKLMDELLRYLIMKRDKPKAQKGKG
jgi:small subunit ribosomal protein S6